MPQRTVTFTLNGIDGLPEEGAVLVFKLLQWGAATDAPLYLRQGKKADPTDSSGVGSISLWVNEDSEKLSIYRVTFPSGENSEFILPTGLGSIDLSNLVLNYAPDGLPPQQINLLNLKADRDAGNIGSSQAVDWRTALSVQSTSEVAAELTLKADKDAGNIGGAEAASWQSALSMGTAATRDSSYFQSRDE
jgi:hypothetical protein